jgi:hypothetical protein
MRKISILLLCVMLSIAISAQRRRAMTVQISYSFLNGGKVQHEEGIRKLMATDFITKSWTEKSGNLIPETPKEAEYRSFIDSLVYNVAQLKDGSRIYSTSKMSDLPVVTIVDDTTKILN